MSDLRTEDDAHLSLAKRLAHSSDKSIRDEAFRVLASWLEANVSANEEEYMKVWKALFYSMWHSDKVPVQQELAFHIARLTRRLYSSWSSSSASSASAGNGYQRAIYFLRAYWRTMQREWMGIDALRLDKFLSLERRMLHEGFVLVAKRGYDEELTKKVCREVFGLALSERPNGIRFHAVDCWVDEIATATSTATGAPPITAAQLQLLLSPLYEHCVETDEKLLFERICKEVFRPLMDRVEEQQREDDDDDDDHDSEEEEGEGKKGAEASKKKVFETPLLMDGHARQEALASAFSKTNLGPIAKDIFAIAALGVTRISHRSPLYALHKELVALALKLKHAKSEEDCTPKPVGAPTPAVSFALEMASKRLGKRLSSNPTASSAVASATAFVGHKRSRDEMEAGGSGGKKQDSEKKEGGGGKKKTKKAEAQEGEEEEEAAKKDALGAAAKKKKLDDGGETRKTQKKIMPTPKASDDLNGDDEATAVLAAIPTAGELLAKSAKGDSEGKQEAKKLAKGILKKTALPAAAPMTVHTGGKKGGKGLSK